MKKFRDDDYWFELTEGPSPDGVGFVRYHQVTCRKCGTQSKARNTGQSVDQMYKFFQRQNWEIGRTRHHHVCPDCAHKHGHRRATEPPKPKPPPSNVVQLRPPPRITLIEAWDRSSENERAEFLLTLEATHGLILARPARAPEPTPDPPETTLYRVIQPGLTHLDYNEIITTRELLAAQEKYGSNSFSVKAVKLEPKVPPVGDDYPQPKEAPVDESWQHGTHIDSMPVQPQQPPIEHPPATAAAQDAAQDDDDDVADWWKEIQEKNKNAK